MAEKRLGESIRINGLTIIRTIETSDGKKVVSKSQMREALCLAHTRTAHRGRQKNTRTSLLPPLPEVIKPLFLCCINIVGHCVWSK